MRSAQQRRLNTPPLNSTAVGAGSGACVARRRSLPARPPRRLAAEERGQVARDRRVLRVGQAELAQAGAHARCGRADGVDLREEAVERCVAPTSSRVSSVRIVPPISLLPRPGTTIGCARRRRARASSFSLAPRQACVSARSCQASSFVPAAASLRATTCASARSMLSPPSRMWSPTATRSSSRSPVALEHGDQREVGGAAADVDDQDDVADRTCLRQRAAAGLEPAVERRLRLFEQRQRAVAGGLGGLDRQLARGRVERRRDRHHHVLLGERRLGVRVVPGAAQVLEVAHRGLERRHARHLGRRVVRQDRGAAVDARVAEPALRARHQPDRRRRAAAARQLADARRGRRPPRAAPARRAPARRRASA